MNSTINKYQQIRKTTSKLFFVQVLFVPRKNYTKFSPRLGRMNIGMFGCVFSPTAPHLQQILRTPLAAAPEILPIIKVSYPIQCMYCICIPT